MSAFCSEVLLDSLSKSARIGANNIVIVGVVALVAAEDIHPDPLLGKIGDFVLDVPVAHVEEELREEGRPTDASTYRDPLCESPARVVEVCTQVWLRCHPQDRQIPGSPGDGFNISHKGNWE